MAQNASRGTKMCARAAAIKQNHSSPRNYKQKIVVGKMSTLASARARASAEKRANITRYDKMARATLAACWQSGSYGVYILYFATKILFASKKSVFCLKSKKQNFIFVNANFNIIKT